MWDVECVSTACAQNAPICFYLSFVDIPNIAHVPLVYQMYTTCLHPSKGMGIDLKVERLQTRTSVSRASSSEPFALTIACLEVTVNSLKLKKCILTCSLFDVWWSSIPTGTGQLHHLFMQYAGNCVSSAPRTAQIRVCSVCSAIACT